MSDTEKESICAAEKVDSVPEGGLRGWTTLAGAFIIQFCGFGYANSFGVYQDYYTRVYITNQSASAISWIGSVNGSLVITTGLVVGRLYDRGYFRHLLYGGSLLTVISLFLLSFAKPNHFYQVFLCQGLGAGLGAGMLYIPSMAVISHYFHKRRDMAMAFVASGASLGSVVHPIMLNNTLNNNHIGFAKATRMNAGLISVLLTISCILMKPGPLPKVNVELKQLLKKLWRDWTYIAATLGLTIFALGYLFPIFYLQVAATSHGLSHKFAFYSIVILNFSNFVGRLASGSLVHRLGIKNLLLASAGCCTALIFALMGLGTVVSVVVLAILYGFFVGIYIAMQPPLITILTDDINELGIRMGISFACSGLGNLAGPPIIGALLGLPYVWWRPAVFSGVMALVGCGCFIIVVIRR